MTKTTPAKKTETVTLESFCRDHLADGRCDLVFKTSLDKDSGKVVAHFQEVDGDGRVGSVRIEGNEVIIQSFSDADGEGKPQSADELAADEAKAKEKAKAK